MALRDELPDGHKDKPQPKGVVPASVPAAKVAAPGPLKPAATVKPVESKAGATAPFVAAKGNVAAVNGYNYNYY